MFRVWKVPSIPARFFSGRCCRSGKPRISAETRSSRGPPPPRSEPLFWRPPAQAARPRQAIPQHPLQSQHFSQEVSRFPPRFQLAQNEALIIFPLPAPNFPLCPAKSTGCPFCTASTFVPLTRFTFYVQNSTMSQETLTRAWEVLQDAYQAQMEGDYDRAAELYQSSLELHPTAEAHTFLGWTYHYQGKLMDAIAECKRAIELDPDFGNPYNDIGAYMIELGQLDEAIPGWQQAVKSRRYEPRHFPHYNLGRAAP